MLLAISDVALTRLADSDDPGAREAVAIVREYRDRLERWLADAGSDGESRPDA